MNLVEMQNRIKTIVNEKYGLQAFAVLNIEGILSMEKLLFNDDLNCKVKNMLTKILRDNYLSETTELDSAENIEDNRKIFYEIVQNEDYRPFSFLDTYNSITNIYSDKNIDHIMGLVFRINVNNTAVWLYQQIVYPQLIKRSRNLYAMLFNGSVYKPLDKDVLKIENKIDILIIDASIITSNIGLMQRVFQFESFVRKEADKTIQMISDMEIIDNLEVFTSLGDQKALANAKKLMKAKKSPVLRMDKNLLLSKLETLPRYKNKFEIENQKIKICTQKQASEFLKMLNDSILKSELTNAEYDSSVKKELSPLRNDE